jgi:hypothetical protein
MSFKNAWYLKVQCACFGGFGRLMLLWGFSRMNTEEVLKPYELKLNSRGVSFIFSVLVGKCSTFLFD